MLEKSKHTWPCLRTVVFFINVTRPIFCEVFLRTSPPQRSAWRGELAPCGHYARGLEQSHSTGLAIVAYLWSPWASRYRKKE